jgi:membrane protein insertase Oxa1/YidC/SpoIIIJ
LAQPQEHLLRLAEFSGLQPSINEVAEEIKSIKKDRAFAFLHNEEYRAFYQQIKDNPLMQQLGYHNL